MIKMITKKNHTNWLMPIGARECNLNIQDNSIRLRLEVLDASNFGVHHSSTEIAGSEVTRTLDMALQNSVWLAVVEGALIVKTRKKSASCLCVD